MSTRFPAVIRLMSGSHRGQNFLIKTAEELRTVAKTEAYTILAFDVKEISHSSHDDHVEASHGPVDM